MSTNGNSCRFREKRLLGATRAWRSGGALELDNGQELRIIFEAGFDRERCTALFSGRSIGRGARRMKGPSGARLEARFRVGRFESEKGFIGSSALEALMRPMLVIPVEVGVDLLPRGAFAQRYFDPPKHFCLQRTEETLDDRGGAQRISCGVSKLDVLVGAPGSESLAVELGTEVGDEILRRVFFGFDRIFEKVADFTGSRQLLEELIGDDSSREMIDDESGPPAKGPALRKREGKPWRPETAAGRDGGQVELPQMMRSSRGNRLGRCGMSGRVRVRFSAVLSTSGPRLRRRDEGQPEPKFV